MSTSTHVRAPTRRSQALSPSISFKRKTAQRTNTTQGRTNARKNERTNDHNKQQANRTKKHAKTTERTQTNETTRPTNETHITTQHAVRSLVVVYAAMNVLGQQRTSNSSATGVPAAIYYQRTSQLNVLDEGGVRGHLQRRVRALVELL